MNGNQEILVEQLHIKCLPDLRRLVEQEAAGNYPDTLNDVIVRVLASHFNRPDLEKVPRKRMGRPPAAMNGNGKRKRAIA